MSERFAWQRPAGRSSILAAVATVVAGCTAVVPPGQPPQVPLMTQNPTLVPVRDHELVWHHLVDVVDDYFRIRNEQRVQSIGNVLTEGRIDTYPQGGATLLEPQRGDSVGSYNLWESTLQTIRREAYIRVIPEPRGFLVEVIVTKELEDLPQPEHAVTGSAMFRTDEAPRARKAPNPKESPAARQWIPQGRDIALEQKILVQLSERLGVLTPGVAYY